MDWECKYCGRFNPRGEYTCVGCSAPRRERILGEWGNPMPLPWHDLGLWEHVTFPYGVPQLDGGPPMQVTSTCSTFVARGLPSILEGFYAGSTM